MPSDFYVKQFLLKFGTPKGIVDYASGFVTPKNAHDGIEAYFIHIDSSHRLNFTWHIDVQPKALYDRLK